jgi:hypothetical protein
LLGDGDAAIRPVEVAPIESKGFALAQSVQAKLYELTDAVEAAALAEGFHGCKQPSDSRRVRDGNLTRDGDRAVSTLQVIDRVVVDPSLLLRVGEARPERLPDVPDGVAAESFSFQRQTELDDGFPVVLAKLAREVREDVPVEVDAIALSYARCPLALVKRVGSFGRLCERMLLGDERLALRDLAAQLGLLCDRLLFATSVYTVLLAWA